MKDFRQKNIGFRSHRMCLIRGFVNSWFCPGHEVVLEADWSGHVPRCARQTGYKGRKCPKCQRKFFVSNQGSISVHHLPLFGLSGESRRKKQRLNRLVLKVIKASEHIGCATILWDSIFEMNTHSNSKTTWDWREMLVMHSVAVTPIETDSFVWVREEGVKSAGRLVEAWERLGTWYPLLLTLLRRVKTWYFPPSFRNSLNDSTANFHSSYWICSWSQMVTLRSLSEYNWMREARTAFSALLTKSLRTNTQSETTSVTW